MIRNIDHNASVENQIAQLVDLIKNPPQGYSPDITWNQDLAKYVIENHNKKNRKARRDHVRKLIADGLRDTGENLSFDEDGQLSNGQHRLYACAESGQLFTTSTKFGAPKDARPRIDSHKKRLPGDTLFINGVKEDYSSIAGAIRWVINYEDFLLEKSKGSKMKVPPRRSPPASEVNEKFFKGLDAEKIKFYVAKSKKKEHIPTPMLTAALYLVDVKGYSSKVRVFLGHLEAFTGPVLALSKEIGHWKGNNRNPRDNAIFAWIIQAILGLYKKSDDLWNKDDPYPVL